MKTKILTLLLLFYISHSYALQADTIENNQLNFAKDIFQGYRDLRITGKFLHLDTKTYESVFDVNAPKINSKLFYTSIVFRNLKSSKIDYVYLLKPSKLFFVNLNRKITYKTLFYYTEDGLKEHHFNRMHERHMEPWRFRASN
jgi:hypothetical protein